ncbi:rhomboid family domain-containing protein [Ditylenchus destructor]|uniref:Rhomboid family domain-containing protein n=1 Tax=Ditylenchus destructor TaxID=166010 RepID=A0AAD4QR74_9BILA|nr:rhomboid family domain-containing protein [Ditylenchus destructor]
MTLLLILVNMIVFWGPPAQRGEGAGARRSLLREERAAPAGAAGIRRMAREDRPQARQGRAPHAAAREAYPQLLEGLQNDRKFLQKLRADEALDLDHQRLPARQHRPPAGQHAVPVPLRLLGGAGAGARHLPGVLPAGRGRRVGAAGWAYAGGTYGLGASGAVSALMGMLRGDVPPAAHRFFYQLFFYFNYVTAPALLLLPAWIANELMQHWLGGQGIAYMAHLGGLLTGAALMCGAMLLGRVKTPETVKSEMVRDDDRFDEHVPRPAGSARR